MKASIGEGCIVYSKRIPQNGICRRAPVKYGNEPILIGRVVSLTIDEDDTPSPEIAQKLAKLACINGNLEKLNDIEPLPPEFDEIINQRVNFVRALDFFVIGS